MYFVKFISPENFIKKLLEMNKIWSLKAYRKKNKKFFRETEDLK